MKLKTRGKNLHKDNWRLGQVDLSDGVKLMVWTKLGDQFGMNLYGAATNWIARTKEFTEQSLVDYINDKLPGFAYTQEAFEEFRKKIKDEYK